MSADLLATQRRFFGALLEPLHGDNRALADLPPGAASPSPGFSATATELLRSTPGLPAEERLGLYQRQYWYRLLDSLAEDFSRVRRLLGRDAFFSALERHLQAYPPKTYTLRTLGADVPGWLARDEATPAALRPWASALAALDYAQLPAFEAADLPAPADADLESAVLVLDPSVQLVPVPLPLSAWLRAAEEADPQNPVPPPAELSATTELHVVWRTPTRRLRETVEPVELLPLLRSLQTGGTLAEIISAADPLPDASLIREAFARWRERHWIALAPSGHTAPDAPAFSSATTPSSS